MFDYNIIRDTNPEMFRAWQQFKMKPESPYEYEKVQTVLSQNVSDCLYFNDTLKLTNRFILRLTQTKEEVELIIQHSISLIVIRVNLGGVSVRFGDDWIKVPYAFTNNPVITFWEDSKLWVPIYNMCEVELTKI